jgi:MtaA/CmuA family methyltransferase
MNSKQRVLSVLEGRQPDRIPNLNIIMQLAAKEINVPYSAYCMDYKLLCAGNIFCAEKYGIDCVTTMSDPMKEASAFGAKVIFPEDGVPYTKEYLLADEAQLLRLRAIDPSHSERMSQSVKAVELYKNRLGDEVAVIGWVEGCMAEAADLRGVNEFLMDLVINEEFVCELMDVCLEQAVLFARAQIDAGADIIGVGDAIASVAGPLYYQKFALPYQIRLLSAIREMGAKTKLHICGDVTPFLEYLPAQHCDIIDLDWMVPLDRAALLFGDKCALSGNYDPVAVLLQGTPESVRQAVIDCSAGVAAVRYCSAGNAAVRYCSAAGCEVPKNTPAANLIAVARTLGSI